MTRSLLLILPVFVGCELSSGNGGPSGNCTDHGQCGELQACLNNNCTDVECITSADCALHSFCDTFEEAFACREGCESDNDCVAGETCSADSHVCEPYGCRSTELDCPVGHSCNTSTGECEAVADLCTRTCDVYSSPNCGNGAECVISTTDECTNARDCEDGYACDTFLVEETMCWSNADCVTPGAVCEMLQCVMSFCHLDYCLPTCDWRSEGEECAAGFSCEQYTNNTGVCYGACDWYIENGYL